MQPKKSDKQYLSSVAPFNFSDPLETIPETGDINLDSAFLDTARGRRQRSMGLWSRAQVVEALDRHAAEEKAP